jgi:hypothetical protein
MMYTQLCRLVSILHQRNRLVRWMFGACLAWVVFMGLGASLAHAQQRHAPEEAPVTTASPDGVVLNHNPADQSTRLTISEALALGPALTTVVPQTAVDLSSEHAPWLPKAASLGALLSLFAAVAGRQAGAWLVSAKEGHIVDHVGEAARQGVGVVVGVGEGW